MDKDKKIMENAAPEAEKAPAGQVAEGGTPSAKKCGKTPAERLKECQQLAEEIYALDEKAYKLLGSSLGRVFTDDRQRCIDRMVYSMVTMPEEHHVRSEVALIGNMARTIPEHDKRSQIMTEYNDIMQKLQALPQFWGTGILDRGRARLNTLTMGDRFGENSHLIICISRSYGSAGNHIGFGLADRLKINYYDAEIFRQVLRRMEADRDGIADSGAFPGFSDPALTDLPDLPKNLEKASKGNPGMESYREKISLRERLHRLNRYHGLPARDAVYFNQSDYICQMAKERDFVVMGRCADVVLKNNNIPHISIFITASPERRIARMMAFNHVDYRTAKKQLKEVDHEHAAYYHYYTGNKWGDARHYDLCINSSSYGIQGSIDFIINMLVANGVKLPHKLDN